MSDAKPPPKLRHLDMNRKDRDRIAGRFVDLINELQAEGTYLLPVIHGGLYALGATMRQAGFVLNAETTAHTLEPLFQGYTEQLAPVRN
jgi:hypothetical protein